MVTAAAAVTPIEDYAFVGDRRTGALIDKRGSVDWLCLPRFDDESLFTALLGTPEHGRWLLGPATDARVSRRYITGSLVLETEYTTDTGSVRVTDAMPTGDTRADLIRKVEGLSGSVRMRHEWIVRFGYGDIVPWVHKENGDSGELLKAVAGPDMLVLRGPRLPRPEGLTHTDEFEVTEGDTLVFDLAWAPSHTDTPPAIDAEEALTATVDESRLWLTSCVYQGEHRDAVTQSVLVLRALTDRDTGGIVAAATTSLPEDMGGERNWDYRYCWLRDAALTVEAMLLAGFHSKAFMWRDWLLRAVAGTPSDLLIMYRTDGGRRLPEWELDHLPGYGNSRPVRVGNAAVDQRQIDVLGEVMIALAMLRENGVAETQDSWALQVALLEDLLTYWNEPDNGLWEIRATKQHFTHSKVMVWAALDRAIRAVEDHGLPGDADRWRTVRDEVRQQVMDRGFNADINSFTQHYDTTEVDAALLVLPVTGFIEATDPKFVGTVERIERDLMRDGYVVRYRTESGVDGLAGDEHPFIICSFWLVTAYSLMGRRDDAKRLMAQLLAVRNDVGLLSEEYDNYDQRLLGNFPQAFSHLGLIQAACFLDAGDP